MPPIFSDRSFLFADGERIPEHEEAFPDRLDRDIGKWCLIGMDTFDEELYSLANDIDTEEDAILLATARLRHLEVTQPTIDSGGQSGDLSTGGIQDRVYILAPNDDFGKRFNPPQSELFGNSPERPR